MTDLVKDIDSDYTTLKAVKEWLSIASDNTNSDKVLQRLISATTSVMSTYLSRSILSASYHEMYNGTDRKALGLRNSPLTDVSSLKVNGVEVAPRLSANSIGTGYVFDDTHIYLDGSCFYKGVQNVEVAYQAGYTDVPMDIEQTCIELVAFRFKERDRVGVASKGIGQETISFTVADLPKSVRMILNQYKQVVPIP